MRILVAAAHPDDELLGAGAALAAHAEKGDEVYVLILGEGQTSRFDERKDGLSLIEELHSDTIRAAGHIGFKEVYFADFPDNRFDSVALLDITKCVESYIEKIQPQIVYTHHPGDLNIDHQMTAKAVLTATRPMEDCPVRSVYAFPTVSSTEWNFAGREQMFIPNMFVEISEEQLEKKLLAMKEYKSELREYPHPRSIEMLKVEAKRWGAVSGTKLAEAFCILRECRRLELS